MERTLDDVVETLSGAKQNRRKCTLLIGAGCSVKAGIPTAEGFVGWIKENRPRAYRRAKEKTYPHCMHELSPSERRVLIANFVDKAKINWAHIGIAQLMLHGYVDRVLTTNFDLLVSKACSLVGLFPAVYDFAASRLYRDVDIPDQAVVHLHGQRTGFVLLNTEKEVSEHSDRMEPVFREAGAGRVWIVVGYSGENDPVFTHLSKMKRFDNNLYWVGYGDQDPTGHVKRGLLTVDKFAFWVRGFDADSFFVKLCQKLGCFPPEFASAPFTHLDRVLAGVASYSPPGESAVLDLTREARNLIGKAREQFEGAAVKEPRERPEERSEPAVILEAQSALLAGEYSKVIEVATRPGTTVSGELQELVSWAHLVQGTALFDQARQKSGAEADALFSQAGEKYEAALKIKPDLHDALNNWGTALMQQGKTKSGRDAERLFHLVT